MKFSVLKGALAAVGLALALVPAASAEILVQMDGISGTSTTEGYRSWIPMRSLTEAVSRPMQFDEMGGASPAGTPELAEISLEKMVDSTSTELRALAITGNPIKTVTIDVTQARDGAAPVVSTRIVLTNARVTTISGSYYAGDQPLEYLSLSYDTIQWTNPSIAADGSAVITKGDVYGYDRVKQAPM